MPESGPGGQTTPAVQKRHSHFWAGVKFVGQGRLYSFDRQSGTTRLAKTISLPVAQDSATELLAYPVPFVVTSLSPGFQSQRSVK